MEDKIIGSHFVNIYQDENGNVVHYANQIYLTIESAQSNARDRKGWKYLYTIEINHTIHPL